jgi:regulatory protein
LLTRQRSLKARALQWLSQREQSRSELQRKLLPYARAELAVHEAALTKNYTTEKHACAAEQVNGAEQVNCENCPTTLEATLLGTAPQWARTVLASFSQPTHVAAQPGTTATEQPTAAAQVEVLLDWLEAHQYLSSERFAESRVHARSARFGNLRIKYELQQHQVPLSNEAAQMLAQTEVERACAVRERKFTQPPRTATEHAKQARFLANRGFSSDAIQSAIRHAGRQHQFDAGDLFDEEKLGSDGE